MKRPVRSAEWLLIGGVAAVLIGVAVRSGWGPGDAVLTVGVLAMVAAGVVLRRRAARAESADAGCRKLLEIACDAVVVVAADRRIAHISPRAAALFGYPPTETLIGQPLSRLLPDWSPAPADWPTVVQGRNGTETGADFPGRTRDGETLALEIATGPTAGPRRGAMTLLIRDVTRARRIREELRAKEAHLRLIVGQMPAILWTTDAQLQITSTVGAGLDALNLRPAEVIGMSMLETLGRDDAECTPVSAHLRALHGESLTHEMEWKGRSFQVRVDPLRNPERRIAGTIGIAVDVTDHKQTVAELKSRVQQQAAIAGLGQQALAGGELDSLLEAVARAVRETLDVEMCEVLELTAEGDTLRPRAGSGWGERGRGSLPAGTDSPAGHAVRNGKPISAADLRIDPRFAADPLVRAHGVVSSLSVLVHGRDRPFGVLSAHATRPRPFTEDDRNFLQAAANVLAAALDRKRAEATHNCLEEQLRQSQKMEAVGRLAGGIAHDFNNLLCVITGYTEMALLQQAAGTPLHGYLTEVNKAGNRAATLVGQLLAFSRKSLLAPKVLDLNVLIRDAGTMLRRLIGEDLELATVFGPDLPSVKADPNQIDQILMNLAVNARDAMPQGGRLEIRTARVTLGEALVRHQPEVQAGHYVLLAVSDTGCGMDEATRARIFEPFFTTKGVGKGTGLGLAMVYGIVKQSGGHIEVETAVGKGTTFCVYLPSVKAAPLDTPPPLPAGAPIGTETVLLAEDEDGVRALVLQVLRRSGYTVLEARDGEEALALSEQHAGPIHLLLTDVVMPRLGGGRLARRVCRQRPDARVLFMSGFADSTLVRHEVISGDIDCLLKPFTPEALARKVRETLDGIVVPHAADLTRRGMQPIP
jgi:PAS domain S-box-containing protein